MRWTQGTFSNYLLTHCLLLPQCPAPQVPAEPVWAEGRPADQTLHPHEHGSQPFVRETVSRRVAWDLGNIPGRKFPWLTHVLFVGQYPYFGGYVFSGPNNQIRKKKGYFRRRQGKQITLIPGNKINATKVCPGVSQPGATLTPEFILLWSLDSLEYMESRNCVC